MVVQIAPRPTTPEALQLCARMRRSRRESRRWENRIRFGMAGPPLRENRQRFPPKQSPSLKNSRKYRSGSFPTINPNPPQPARASSEVNPIRNRRPKLPNWNIDCAICLCRAFHGLCTPQSTSAVLFTDYALRNLPPPHFSRTMHSAIYLRRTFHGLCTPQSAPEFPDWNPRLQIGDRDPTTGGVGSQTPPQRAKGPEM